MILACALGPVKHGIVLLQAYTFGACLRMLAKRSLHPPANRERERSPA